MEFFMQCEMLKVVVQGVVVIDPHLTERQAGNNREGWIGTIRARSPQV